MQRVPHALPLPLHSWLWFVLVNKQGCSAASLLHVSAHKGQSASPPQHFHTHECIITPQHMNQRTAFDYPFPSTFMPSCLLHTYPGFPTFICTSKGWILPIPLSDNLQEHLSWVCHPFLGVTAGSSQGKPLFTQSQSTSGSAWGTVGIPKAAFPLVLLQVSRARGRDKAVGYTSTSLTMCPDILGSNFLRTIDLLSSVPALYEAGKPH